MTARGRAVMRAIATVLLVAGVACIGTVLRADASPDAAAAAVGNVAGAGKSNATPLLSPRRLPSLFTDMVAAQRLQASVDFAFSRWNACVAIDGQGRALARRAAAKPLAPASTQKLLTGAAALSVFGPQHRFTTRAVTTAPVTDGTIRGDLYVVGGGDPMLATPAFTAWLHARVLTSTEPVTPLESLADAIHKAGIRHVDGALIGDDSRHDRLRFLPSWKPSYHTGGETGALSALGVDHGFASPGTATAAADPAGTTVARLAELLTARGVTIGGGERSSTAPSHAREVAHVDSPRLDAIVAAMLTASDNYVAETLAREVGVARGHNGTTDAGTVAIVAVLKERGIATDGVTLLDGSGLAPGNRVTCNALLGVVDLAAAPRFTALDQGLAVAGKTGTLALRFLGDPLRGVLRAKTGHIEGVSGFAGVVDDAQHLRFAFLVNGPFSTGQGEFLQATIARLVAAYPQAQDTTVVPAP